MSKFTSFWVYKFDPQIITIDDLRRHKTCYSANPDPHINDLLLLLNGASLCLEAVGKISGIDHKKRYSIHIVHKPRQITPIRDVSNHLPKSLAQEIRKSDLSDFTKLDPIHFDSIIALWWGIDNYSKEFC